MWLVLCSPDDVPALWAASRLRARGLDPLAVLTPELLHYSFAWEHRLHREGGSSIAFTLADGARIEGGAIRGVLNRIAALPVTLVEPIVPADRLYTLQEWTALHISWLSSLRAPVLNLPVMAGLCGAWRHGSEWAWLAGQAGLEPPLYQQGVGQYGAAATRPAEASGGPVVRTVIVVDGQPVDAHLPDALADGCARLAALARTRILGVDLDARTGAFIGASPRPDLRLGGDVVVDALVHALNGPG